MAICNSNFTVIVCFLVIFVIIIIKITISIIIIIIATIIIIIEILFSVIRAKHSFLRQKKRGSRKKTYFFKGCLPFVGLVIFGHEKNYVVMMVQKTELWWCHFKDKVEPFGVWQKSISRVKHFPMLLYGSSPKVTFFPLQILGANGHVKFISFHKSLDGIFFFFPLKLLMFDTFWWASTLSAKSF